MTAPPTGRLIVKSEFNDYLEGRVNPGKDLGRGWYFLEVIRKEGKKPRVMTAAVPHEGGMECREYKQSTVDLTDLYYLMKPSHPDFERYKAIIDRARGV